MSKKSKTGGTGSNVPTDKVKIVKVDEGSLNPVFESTQTSQPKEGAKSTGDSAVFRLEPEVILDPVESGLTGEVKLRGFEPHQEIELLKPQVKDITDLHSKENLNSGQVDILKRYIGLKETEVRDLREQLRQHQEYVKKLSSKLEKSLAKNKELLEGSESHKHSHTLLQTELEKERKRHAEDLMVQKNDYEERIRQLGVSSEQARDFLQKKEEWKLKIKEDLKKVRLKERELENRYELLKRDTQALLDSKDKHILELKKKNDALDLELENLDERLRFTAAVLNGVGAKKRRLIDTMKLAISLLEEIDKDVENIPQTEPRKAG